MHRFTSVFMALCWNKRKYLGFIGNNEKEFRRIFITWIFNSRFSVKFNWYDWLQIIWIWTIYCYRKTLLQQYFIYHANKKTWFLLLNLQLLDAVSHVTTIYLFFDNFSLYHLYHKPRKLIYVNEFVFYCVFYIFPSSYSCMLI